ncbi:MAG: HemK/PrmC family methyltransferase [Nitriliruptoraceae bacterium]
MSIADPSAPEVRTTARELQRAVARLLAEADVAAPEADARWLLEAALGADPHHQPGRLVEAAERIVLDAMVERRRAREPLQFIVGGTAFLDLWIECRAGVFIPRPETEVVARLAIEVARRAPAAPIVVEPCTGTGAIACALVAHVDGVQVIATDISVEAVTLARHNLARVVQGEAGRVLASGASADVRHGRLFDPVDTDLVGRVDVIVANPPYLPLADRATWSPEVADGDPLDALVGGENGHEVVDRLLRLAPRWLRPGGTVILEIDERRAIEATEAANAAGLTGVRIVDDLTGAPRVVVARRRAES